MTELPQVEPSENNQVQLAELVTCEKCFSTYVAGEKCSYCEPEPTLEAVPTVPPKAETAVEEKQKATKPRRRTKKEDRQPPTIETCPKCGYSQKRYKGGAFKCVHCGYLSPIEKKETFLCSNCGIKTTRRYGTTTNPICRKCKSRNGVLTRDTTETKFLGN